MLAHRDQIEAHIFGTALALFDTERTVTLFDVTNTYLEGTGHRQTLAQRGHSKERRSDCPLITLALVVDGSGFVQRSRVVAGTVQENQTLKGMLQALECPKGSIVVMDRGVATEANVQYLKRHGYRYLVVSRQRERIFDSHQVTALQNGLQVYGVGADGEQRVYCRRRIAKEKAILKRRRDAFEKQLQKLHDGLSTPRKQKRLDLIWERLGRKAKE